MASRKSVSGSFSMAGSKLGVGNSSLYKARGRGGTAASFSSSITSRGQAHSLTKLGKCKNQVNNFVYDMFTYSTVRSATIKSHGVGVVYRLAQLLLLYYIIGWELIHNKGYQATDTVSSVVTTKVKGQGFVPIATNKDTTMNKSDPEYYKKLYKLNPNITYKILDTADYIIPPNEYNSIFIMTNFIETVQSQGICDEEQSKINAVCHNDTDCINLGAFMNTWNGIPTGKCVPSSVSQKIKVCEVKAWCPTEHDSERKEDTLIRNVLNYTIFIKNDIEFKRFKKKQRNIAPNLTNQYISRCTYEDLRDPYCPVFQVGYVLEKAEPDSDEKYKMLIKGGVILIEIIWNCDFDFHSPCLPIYSFRRFDTKESNTASGFNFRFANKFIDNQKEYRVLYKAFGLRFIINVSGTAGKFSIVPLMLTIGAGFGLMSLSVIVADCVMLHCTKNKSLYQKIKELDLNEEIPLDEIEEEEEGEEENRVDNNESSNNREQNATVQGASSSLKSIQV